MTQFNRILAVLDGSDADVLILAKAVTLAHQHGAALELFLCNAERAYSLLRAYDPTGVGEARRDCIRQARHYLERLKDTAVGADIRISVDAVCESPLYEGIVRKVLRSRPDLVIKNAAGAGPLHRFAWEANDWQLMRACPTTLLLSRGKLWHPCPRLAAAVDVSEQETTELVRAIVQISKRLTEDCHGELDLLYSELREMGTGKREAHLAALQALTRAEGLQGDPVHVLAGPAEQTLPAFAADRNYDVFVMGALTHRKGVATLVGTLTSRLIETLDCDFVLVKPSAYRSQVELSTELPPEDPEETSLFGPRPAVSADFVTPWQLPEAAQPANRRGQ